MESDPDAADEQSQRKRRERILGVVGLIAIAVGVVWKFLSPWTNLKTDVAAIVVMFIGLIAASRLKNPRGS